MGKRRNREREREREREIGPQTKRDAIDREIEREKGRKGERERERESLHCRGKVDFSKCLEKILEANHPHREK